MKIGKTYQETKSIQDKEWAIEKEKRKALAMWHHWFAWKPVVLENGQYAWFETVLRRAEYLGDFTKFGYYNYRALK